MVAEQLSEHVEYWFNVSNSDCLFKAIICDDIECHSIDELVELSDNYDDERDKQASKIVVSFDLETIKTIIKRGTSTMRCYFLR